MLESSQHLAFFMKLEADSRWSFTVLIKTCRHVGLELDKFLKTISSIYHIIATG